jgi:hypothetical protein
LRKRVFVLTAVAVLVLGLAVPMVLAGLGATPLNRQSLYPVNEAQKSNKTWSKIPGISDVSICTDSGFWSADLSLTATGGAFRVRLKLDDDISEVAHFDPTATQRTFSTSFAGSTGGGTSDIDFEWRSARGDTVRLRHGWARFFFQICP